MHVHLYNLSILSPIVLSFVELFSLVRILLPMVLSFVKLFSLMQLVIRSNVEIAKIEKSSQWPRQNLKLVEIPVYNGHKCCVKQFKYLMKNAIVLEKIVINLVRFWCLSTAIEQVPMGE